MKHAGNQDVRVGEVTAPVEVSAPRSQSHSLVVFGCCLFTCFGVAEPACAQGNSGSDILRQISGATAQVAEKTSPAVVGIWVDIPADTQNAALEDSPGVPANSFASQADLGRGRSGSDSPPDDRSSPRSPQGQFSQMQPHKQALGSGFIVSKDGYIVTNNHVVGNADLVLVIVGDDEPVRAQVIGTDSATDLAVIKVQTSAELPVLPFGDSDKLRVGDWVIAVGQPFGLSHTVTTGIISALRRNNIRLAAYEDFIQTNAAINPGNSGGPLVNLDGQVIGVNTAILGPEGNIGIGFAIPANMAKEVYEQIRKNGKVIRGFLGVSIQDLTPDLVAAFDLPAQTKGITVSHVAENSPAQAAGLRQGDIILELDGKPIDSATALQTYVSMLQPGSKITVGVLRDGARQNLTIALGARPSPSAGGDKHPALEVLGMAVENLTGDLADRLGYSGKSGVVVVAVADDSIAGLFGIGPGMLIEEVDRRPVKNMSDFKTAIEEAAKKPPILFLVNNQGSYRYIALHLPQQ